MDIINGLLNKGQELMGGNLVGTLADTAYRSILDSIHRDPTQLDSMVDTQGGSIKTLYDSLGPTGQENLKGIIAQDANFLPALTKAMEGDGPSSQFAKMPPGLVNVVLAEANQDPQFRTQLTDALQNDPSKVMDVVGAEAGRDMNFGLNLGKEGLRSAVSGDMDMAGMGNMFKGMMGGMLGGLMENMGQFFQQFMGMLGQFFGSIMGFLGGDRLVQSVGDKPPGQRPADELTAVAEQTADRAGLKLPDRGQLYAVNKDGIEPYKPAPVEVGAEVSMRDAALKDPAIKDPSQAMMAGPR